MYFVIFSCTRFFQFSQAENSPQALESLPNVPSPLLLSLVELAQQQQIEARAAGKPRLCLVRVIVPLADSAESAENTGSPRSRTAWPPLRCETIREHNVFVPRP
jgi:hypothetical protein